jgi:hypothetical protein
MKSITARSDSAGDFSRSVKRMLRWIINFIAPMLLPILFGIVPTLYHYSNNVEKLALSNLSRMLVFNILLIIIFYFFIAIFSRFQAVKTAIMTFVFLIFFNVYGLAYRYLINLDVIRLKHYTFLPLMLMFAIYILLPLTKLKNPALVGIWKNLLLIVGLLAIYNTINIIPSEINKWSIEQTVSPINSQEQLSIDKKSPDIYYIILDEFAGFQAMREYWHNDEVDDFVTFLKDRGLFVAEESHGSSTDTLHQVATRLNYQEYPLGEEYIQTYFNDIASNRVMRELKSRGYTIVVFDETNMVYPSSKSINADYLYEYGSPAIPKTGGEEYGFYFDEFGELVIDNTMLYAFSQNYRKNNQVVADHSNMISFTVENIANKKVASPKFVYVHLLLPHFPFIFNRNGNIMDRDQFTNWQYYLENYMFSIKVAESMIDNILAEADLKNPPVIILQSDHGARNHLTSQIGSAALPNYPEKFKTLILFALSLPGYDYSSLSQDINPINTFPIVLNYLFDANIVLKK